MKLDSNYSLGQVVREARIGKKLTQAELAKRADLTRSWLVKLENGKVTPGWDLVLRLTEVLDLELNVQPRETGINAFKKRVGAENRKVQESASENFDLDNFLKKHLVVAE